MALPDPDETYSKFIRWKRLIKEHPVAGLIIILILILLPTSFIIFNIFFNKTLGLKTNDPSPIVNRAVLNTNEQESNETNFQMITDKHWDLSALIKKDKNVLCLKPESNFEFKSIWLKDSIPLVPIQMTLRFSAFENNGYNLPARLVISVGKDEKVSEFYLPLFDSQVINFKQLELDNGQLTFTPGQQLSSTILKGATIEVVVNSEIISGNQILFKYKVKYVSSKSKQTVDDTFIYNISSFDPNPIQVETQLGIGVFKGSCMQLIGYEVK